MKGLDPKGPLQCLGFQLRIKRVYQVPINYSFLWLVKYNLNTVILVITKTLFLAFMFPLQKKPLQKLLQITKCLFAANPSFTTYP